MAFSFPHASANDDRIITSEMERARIKTIAGDGIKRSFVGAVKSNTLTVTDGAAVVNGCYFDIGGKQATIDLSRYPGNSGQTLYINLTYSSASRSVDITASTSQSLQKSDATYELRLGTIPYQGTAWGQITWNTIACENIEEMDTTNQEQRFIKYSSGRMEAWGIKRFNNVAISSSWGAMYLSDYFRVPLPKGFTSVASCNVTLHTYGAACAMYPSGSPPTTEHSGQFYLVRPSKETVPYVEFHYHAIGAWK